MVSKGMSNNKVCRIDEDIVLFEKKYVSEEICGNYNRVENVILKTGSRENKREIFSMSDRYNQITTTWTGYQDDDSEFDNSNLEYSKNRK